MDVAKRPLTDRMKCLVLHVDEKVQPWVGVGCLRQAARQEAVPEDRPWSSGKAKSRCEATSANTRCQFDLVGEVSPLTFISLLAYTQQQTNVKFW